eukprot:ANDGO_03261.mRNA.1 hypothetical protein
MRRIQEHDLVENRGRDSPGPGYYSPDEGTDKNTVFTSTFPKAEAVSAFTRVEPASDEQLMYYKNAKLPDMTREKHAFPKDRRFNDAVFISKLHSDNPAYQGRESPGPGVYEPKYAATSSTVKGGSFSKSSGQLDPVLINASQVPGPKYDLKSSLKTGKVECRAENDEYLERARTAHEIKKRRTATNRKFFVSRAAVIEKAVDAETERRNRYVDMKQVHRYISKGHSSVYSGLEGPGPGGLLPALADRTSSPSISFPMSTSAQEALRHISPAHARSLAVGLLETPSPLHYDVKDPVASTSASYTIPKAGRSSVGFGHPTSPGPAAYAAADIPLAQKRSVSAFSFGHETRSGRSALCEKLFHENPAAVPDCPPRRYLGPGFEDSLRGTQSPGAKYNVPDSVGKAPAFTFSKTARVSPFVASDAAGEATSPTNSTKDAASIASTKFDLLELSPRDSPSADTKHSKGFTISGRDPSEDKRFISASHAAVEIRGRESPGPVYLPSPSSQGRVSPHFTIPKAPRSDPANLEAMRVPGPMYYPHPEKLSTYPTTPAYSIMSRRSPPTSG